MKTERLESAERLDIHNIDGDLEACLKTLEKESSKENWDLIKKYNTLLTATAVSKATRRKELRTILSLNRLNNNKAWESMTQQDMITLVSDIMNKYSQDGQETWSTYNHKRVLKIFFRWIRLGDRDFREVDDPPETKKIKIKNVKETLTREQLVADKDRRNMIASCDDLQSKALIDTTDEGACRMAEMLTLKIKHISFDKNGAIIRVDGKTGARPIRLVRSSKNLLNWVNSHPFRTNPESWLYIGIRKGVMGKRMSYSTARNILLTAAKRAGVDKRVFFTLFRHSGITNVANFLSDAQMRQRHGWTKNSIMPGRYTHLVGADVESAVLKHHGLKKESQVVEIQKCKFCDAINSIDVLYCENCSKPLDIKTAIEADKKRDEDMKKQIDEAVTEKLHTIIDKEMLKIKTELLEKKLKNIEDQKADRNETSKS
ncbi:MAG TPA: site-specific integrase [Candidatus Nitrosotenuis sp.]